MYRGYTRKRGTARMRVPRRFDASAAMRLLCVSALLLCGWVRFHHASDSHSRRSRLALQT